MEDSKLFAALETFSGDVNEVADFLLQERGWYGLLLLILSACIGCIPVNHNIIIIVTTCVVIIIN